MPTFSAMSKIGRMVAACAISRSLFTLLSPKNVDPPDYHGEPAKPCPDPGKKRRNFRQPKLVRQAAAPTLRRWPFVGRGLRTPPPPPAFAVVSASRFRLGLHPWEPRPRGDNHYSAATRVYVRYPHPCLVSCSGPPAPPSPEPTRPAPRSGTESRGSARSQPLGSHTAPTVRARTGPARAAAPAPPRSTPTSACGLASP